MSREMTNKEAISNLNHIYGFVSPDIQRSLDLAIKALEERQQGEWIDQDFDDLKISDYRCNQCGHYQDDITNFCPECGADMRGGKE